uniref:Uncharacterized protein n=1 Tax=Acrobeloides nanus TaxID=290746 RepID=A0A914E263_9BILA
MKAFIYLLTNPSLFQQYCLPIELNIRAFFPYSTPVPIPQRMNSFFHVLGISHDIQMHKCFLYLALCDYKVMDVCERLFHAFCHEWYSGFPFKAIVFGIPFFII